MKDFHVHSASLTEKYLEKLKRWDLRSMADCLSQLQKYSESLNENLLQWKSKLRSGSELQIDYLMTLNCQFEVAKLSQLKIQTNFASLLAKKSCLLTLMHSVLRLAQEILKPMTIASRLLLMCGSEIQIATL